MWLASNRPDIEFHVPELPFSPALAVSSLITDYFGNTLEFPSGIMGSSLGGYYALYLSAKYRLRAAIVNPAVKPFILLKNFLGENVNLHTGLHYQLDVSHIDELLDLQINPNDLENHQILSVLQTGDQTLNYREAAKLLNSQPMWIIPGGTHEFDNFERVISAMIHHFNI